MKITFQNQSENRIESPEAGRQRKAEQTVSKKAYGAYTLSLMSSAEKKECHYKEYSICFDLPPYAAAVFVF